MVYLSRPKPRRMLTTALSNMKLITVSMAIAAPFPFLVSTISIAARSSNPRVLGFDISRETLNTNQVARHQSKLHKRQQVVEQKLDIFSTEYAVNVTLGTPPQSVRLTLDTGTSDLWVNPATFNTSSSFTYRLINNNFSISYADGTAVSGNYSSDVLTWGGVSLKGFQFGVAENSTSVDPYLTYQGNGILGIGYASNEVQVFDLGLRPYPNLPLVLVNDGLIKSNAYSLWPNDLNADTGTILFGGVDRAKYHGNLITKTINGINGFYSTVSVEVTGLGINGHKVSSSNLPLSAMVDMGTTLIYLPDDIATMIYDQTNAFYDSASATAYADCTNLPNSTIDFDFGGQIFSIPRKNLVLHGLGSMTVGNNTNACVFGIQPAQAAGVILGDTFLRSAYVVFDLAHNEISLAPTVFNATDSDIREIIDGVLAIPSLTSASASSTPTISAITSPSSSASSTPSSSTGGLKKGAIIGGTVGGVGGLIALGVIIFFLSRRHRGQRRPLPRQESVHEKAQLHSDDFKPQARELEAKPPPKELEGKSAPHDLWRARGLAAEMPANEDVAAEK